MSENETTLCGGCLERVYVNRLHACEPIKELKRKIDMTLSNIQQDYERKFQEVNGTLRNHRSLNAHLESEIVKLKRKLSTCIDVKLLYSDRQARETWQNDCDVMICNLLKRIDDMEVMFKFANGCVDNSHAIDASKYLGLAPIAKLIACVKEELTGAIRIAELERTLEFRNVECQAALNESNKLRERVVELSEENKTLR